jgi:hypothetical protein
MISIYYVYYGDSGEWITDSVHGDGSDNWHDAHEFFELQEAQHCAERHGGVVFGWVQ